MYKVIGKIDGWDDIPWDAPIIVTGSIGGSDTWMLRMPGVFKNDNGSSRFLNDFGMPTHFKKGDLLALNILERRETE